VTGDSHAAKISVYKYEPKMSNEKFLWNAWRLKSKSKYCSEHSIFTEYERAIEIPDKTACKIKAQSVLIISKIQTNLHKQQEQHNKDVKPIIQ
jgi:hypothetical protein